MKVLAPWFENKLSQVRLNPMNSKFTLPFLLISTFVISGCSIKKEDTNNQIETIYKVLAIAKSSVDKNGNPCADAVGVIKIFNKKVTGKATDSIGRRFSIIGESSNGVISGGFALSKQIALKFNGQINKVGYASGTWKDMFQCNGTWTAKKVISRKFRQITKKIKT